MKCSRGGIPSRMCLIHAVWIGVGFRMAMAPRESTSHLSIPSEGKFTGGVLVGEVVVGEVVVAIVVGGIPRR